MPEALQNFSERCFENDKVGNSAIYRAKRLRWLGEEYTFEYYM
jgi:predicted RNA-binding Zn-ribbon protein involved in translation (DUF1610 family)